jgi:hypothetical protein
MLGFNAEVAMKQRVTTGLWVPLLAACIVGAPTTHAQVVEPARTEWAIAPEGTTRHEGPLAPEARSAPKAPMESESTQEIPHISGGVGLSEREELAQVKSQYNLWLLFAVQGSGEYLSDIQVRIDEASGPTRLTAVSDGPLFYARLPPGRYVITAAAAGRQSQTHPVAVPKSGAAEQSFYWAPHDTTGDAMPR